MKKKLSLIAVVIVLLIIAPFLYVKIASSVMNGGTNDNRIAYLRSHSAVIDAKHPIPANFFSAPDTTLTTVWLFGESHGFMQTEDFAITMLSWLNNNYGVKRYFTELTTEQAEMVNRFLSGKTSDNGILTSLAKSERSDIHVPQHYTVDFINKWKRLYLLNNSLDSANRITVYGLLGKDKDYKGNRDKVMMNNFVKIANQLPDKAYYCSTGLSHVLQSPYNNHQPFAALLKRKDYKVVSVAHAALDCECYFPKNDQYPTPPGEKADFLNNDGPMICTSGINNLREASGEQATVLYNLCAPESPYHYGNDLVGFHSPLSFITGEMIPEKGHSTTDFFQYLLLTRGYPSPKALK